MCDMRNVIPFPFFLFYLFITSFAKTNETTIPLHGINIIYIYIYIYRMANNINERIKW